MQITSRLPKSAFEQNALIYKLMANPKRLEILNALRDREYSVEELTQLLEVPKPNVSQHLALLRAARLVRVRRNGLSAYYRITDRRIVDPCRILYSLHKEKSFR
jgi:DNA-binding transcriptional ArsR family regulator